jgi:hypothetical protein
MKRMKRMKRIAEVIAGRGFTSWRADETKLAFS